MRTDIEGVARHDILGKYAFDTSVTYQQALSAAVVGCDSTGFLSGADDRIDQSRRIDDLAVEEDARTGEARLGECGQRPHEFAAGEHVRPRNALRRVLDAPIPIVRQQLVQHER